VIILTAHATVEKTAVAFKAGARDLLQKPFDLHNLVQSVQEALEFKPPATGDVESKLTRKTDEKFYQYYMDTIQSLFAVVEGKSEIVHGHCARVACYALLLAKRLDLMEAELRNLEILALVHDIGKIAVPNTVLEKKSPLTAAEDRILHSHVLVGEGILRPLRFLPDGDKVIRHHHEAFNGRGYPDGLSKENIPLFSRIIAIVDAFDNRLSARPYNVRSQEGVLADMKRLGGILFDPVLLEMFIQAYSKTMLLKTQSPAN
jgi:putative nucleotidyltransferase with HDIG domain